MTLPATLPTGTSWNAASDGCPIEQRAVLVMHHYLGLRLPEIAETLGIPEGTVRSRLHYATLAMRAVLEADARPVRIAEGGRSA